MLWRVTVQRQNPGEPVGFNPQEQAAQSGDSVFWVNEDSNTEHQPYPASGATTAWFASPIPPRSSSDQVRIAAGTTAYACALHADETGTIVTANAVSIGATLEGGAAFLPQSLTIQKEQSVVWNNSDSRPHRPMPQGGPSDAWLSHDIAPGESSAFVAFGNAGADPYVCALHPEETGTLTVK